MLTIMSAHGQTHEFGLLGGGGYYIGDLNPFKHYGKNTRMAAMALHRVNFNQRFSLKSHFAYTTLTAYDAHSNEEWRQNRNLHFKSPLIEVGSQFEINYFNYAIGLKEHSISPYLFAGLTIFRFNPKGEIDDNWIDLQPLGTEGQGMEDKPRKYALTGLAVPFGFGLKANLGDFMSIGFEWGLRKTFTDYLDDVSTTYADNDELAAANGELAAHFGNQSLNAEDITYSTAGTQRGNSANKDYYVISGLFITVQVGGKNKCPKPL